MSRAVAFLAAALLAATIGAAQNGPTGAAAASSQASGDTSGQTRTITGCLSSSSFGDNHFNLTEEKTGKVYSLAGLTDQLTSHAGQEVRITGIDNSSNSASGSGAYDSPNPNADTGRSSAQNSNPDGAASPTKSGRQSLQVTAVQKIADHCSNSSESNKPKGADIQAEDREQAHVRLISYKTIADDEGTLAGSSDQNSAHADSSAPTGADQANDLPRTATALPLLGILGLGSLVAGFIVRR